MNINGFSGLKVTTQGLNQKQHQLTQLKGKLNGKDVTVTIRGNVDLKDIQKKLNNSFVSNVKQNENGYQVEIKGLQGKVTVQFKDENLSKDLKQASKDGKSFDLQSEKTQNTAEKALSQVTNAFRRFGDGVKEPVKSFAERARSEISTKYESVRDSISSEKALKKITDQSYSLKTQIDTDINALSAYNKLPPEKQNPNDLKEIHTRLQTHVKTVDDLLSKNKYILKKDPGLEYELWTLRQQANFFNPKNGSSLE